MIAYLNGEIFEKHEDGLVILTGGVGYRVNMAQITAALFKEGQTAGIYISQSFSQFDGVVLYGFASKDEQLMFELLRDAIPKTGAKRALEFLNKALRSLPDFQNAIIKKDAKLLTGIFGFTAKTAEKLIDALKDKIGGVHVEGSEKIIQAPSMLTPSLAQVVNALISLGYSAQEAKKAVNEISSLGQASNEEDVPALIKQALRTLSK